MLPYVYRVTKYDPADRDERGYYTGAEDSVSDHGPVEAAYVAAVAAFAEASGVRELELREPQVPSGLVHFGLEPVIDGYGLDGLLPGGVDGLHDGVRVPVAVGQEIVRAMLRDHGVWCRLEDGERFAVHIGWDQYMYIGSHAPCEQAVAGAHAAGLFAERVDASPYDPQFDEPGRARPADEVFWARLRLLVERGAAGLLEEQHLQNAARWHRLTPDTLDAVRVGLAPRAQLTVWPDLLTGLPAATAALAALDPDDSVELVAEHPDGRITATLGQAAELLAAPDLPRVRRAAVLPITVDDRHPLLTAVLPDPDGTLRARWRPDPAPGDAHWERLRALRVGETAEIEVLTTSQDGTAAADFAGLPAVLHGPAEPGQRVTARITAIDLVAEQVVFEPHLS